MSRPAEARDLATLAGVIALRNAVGVGGETLALGGSGIGAIAQVAWIFSPALASGQPAAVPRVRRIDRAGSGQSRGREIPTLEP